MSLHCFKSKKNVYFFPWRTWFQHLETALVFFNLPKKEISSVNCFSIWHDELGAVSIVLAWHLEEFIDDITEKKEEKNCIEISALEKKRNILTLNHGQFWNCQNQTESLIGVWSILLQSSNKCANLSVATTLAVKENHNDVNIELLTTHDQEYNSESKRIHVLWYK